MGNRRPEGLIRHLPLVVAVTFIVAVCPVLGAWLLARVGVSSPLLLVAAGVILSLGISLFADRAWRTLGHGHDLLFNEVMLWGYLRRLRTDRQLSNAASLLGVHDVEQRAFAARLPLQQRALLLEGLAGALETSDPYTHGHSRRVARMAAHTAAKLGLSKREVAKIRTAAVLHDVGKIHTPVSVLHKPGRLTEAEYEIVKHHPVDGADMVGVLQDDELTSIVLHHHERLDGGGYPSGLRGSEIPLGARIIAVCDTFDALTSRRPYRSAQPHRKAIAILQREAGTQLDGAVVRAFRAVYSGRRPLALWTALTQVPQRLGSIAGGAANGSLGHALGIAAGTAAIAGASSAALAAPSIAHSHKRAAVQAQRRVTARSAITSWAAANALPPVSSARLGGRRTPRGTTRLVPTRLAVVTRPARTVLPSAPIAARAGTPGPPSTQGPAGPAGAQGPAGSPGTQGLRGPAGARGSAGAAGARGSAGARGPAGSRGPSGATGAVGPTGPAGATGLAGLSGDTGPAGPSGATGPVGPAGAAGPAGPVGATGSTGAVGATGSTGATGSPGAAGPAGDAGPAGPPGADGATGPAGPAGPAGATGPIGPSGPQGATGPPGPSGLGTLPSPLTVGGAGVSNAVTGAWASVATYAALPAGNYLADFRADLSGNDTTTIKCGIAEGGSSAPTLLVTTLVLKGVIGTETMHSAGVIQVPAQADQQLMCNEASPTATTWSASAATLDFIPLG